MQKHPDIELLLKYSNGSIEPALSVAIGLHQQQCQYCQQRVADLEKIAGVNLEAQNDALIDDDAFDKLLDNIDDDTSLDDSKTIIQQSSNLAPQVSEKILLEAESLAVAQSDLALLNQLSSLNFENLQWQKVTSKISKADIAMNDSVFQVELMKFAANAKIPKHTHQGREFTLVLQGDFSDNQGMYKTGEFIAQDASNEHQPVAGQSGCICLAITDAPLKFTGMFGPLINWMTR